MGRNGLSVDDVVEDVVRSCAAEPRAPPAVVRSEPADGVLQHADAKLKDFWPPLESGTYRVAAHLFSPTRCLVVLRSHAWLAPAPAAAPAEILNRVVSGESQKNVAMDFGVSGAAVAMRTRRFIRRLGLHCRVSALPLFVVMAGLAHRHPSLDRVVRVTRRCFGRVELSVCSLSRIDRTLPGGLSSAESEVARCLVFGLPQAEIAFRRRTSYRTAGNQIGAVFSKLGVSGRLELVRRLAAADSPTRHEGQQ